ncbi:hypothetical protein [Aulosira sp. FACHB-615]|uniref:hypothetical protein n=1 Tax=Aulosira sp. FACHB-615 TaxID=2692777 RepID=UPI001A7EB0EA|nr:hypothetical protein [Aulosira sp. FACHB-615]
MPDRIVSWLESFRLSILCHRAVNNIWTALKIINSRLLLQLVPFYFKHDTNGQAEGAAPRLQSPTETIAHLLHF